MGLKTVPLARFWSDLATILPEIAKSEYVAIDFEMTGIEPRCAPKLHKPTMDELYQRAKQATETFSVVQFGITCITFDDTDKANTIHLKSYNFNVSPMFDTSYSGVDVIARTLDRTLTLSYKTLMFLKRNRIRIEDAYDGGIPYLSRAEEAEITPELFVTQKHGRHEHIILERQKPETREFYRDTVSHIRSWEQNPKRPSYLNIINPHEGALTRFQRRLVYQIVDAEFDGKYGATVNENVFMQITEKDTEKEEQVCRDPSFEKHRIPSIANHIDSSFLSLKDQRQKTNNLECALAFQRGLRYIIEALVGGDFAKDVWKMYKIDHGMVDPDCKAILQASEKTLKHKRPILLGHNMFHDLCFLHAAFFGPLPDTLDEFGRILHGLFPRIMDTKHILKRDDNEMMPAKGLDEIFVEIEGRTVPFIIDGERIRQEGKLHMVNEHQAGHDSYKTSVVFLKEMWKRVVDEKTRLGKSKPKNHQYAHQLLQWDSDVAQGFANMVRVGNAGLWDIGKDEA